MRALVAVDGSVNAAVVMEAVAPWLRASGSTAELMTVLDESEIRAIQPESRSMSPTAPWAGSALPPSDAIQMVLENHSENLDRIEAGTSEQLRALIVQHFTGIPCDVRVMVARHTPSAIIAEARLTKADAIAIGTRGRGGLTSLLLGSSAHQVVMASPVPVFIVRA